MHIRFPNLDDIQELERHCLSRWAIEWGFVHYFDSLLNQNVEKLITFLPLMAQGKGIPEGHVPCTFKFAFDDKDKLIGRVSIRHHLNSEFEKSVGHIGYAVIPGQREQGYGELLLEYALDYSKKHLGLSEIILTCDSDNIASIKIIEKKKGILEEQYFIQALGTQKLKYKIKL